MDTDSPDGGIGRRAGLKIQFPQGSVGSTPSPGTTYLRGGTVVVTARPNSPYWQVRIKRDGKWKHLSLQTTDHTEACAKALNYCDNPHPGKRAKTSFAHYADIMGDKWRTGSQAIYRTYFGLLSRWVQPYFNKFQLKDIGAQTLVDYYDWFEKKLGRRPAKSTINHHNTVIRAVFDRAANDKIINRGDIPKITIKGHGRANNRRPHFDIEEVERMMGNCSPPWLFQVAGAGVGGAMRSWPMASSAVLPCSLAVPVMER